MDSKENKTFCKETEDLLREWDMEELIPVFAEKQVDLEVLRNLTADDINLLIECFGLRIRFRTKLNEWRKYNDLLPSVRNISGNDTQLVRRDLEVIHTSETYGRNFAENIDITNEFMESPRVSYIQTNNIIWSNNTFNLSGPFLDYCKEMVREKLAGAAIAQIIQYFMRK
ncbi:uncharacterized protein LOC119678375 isoform X2 [Teleopsis dalmanni]|uniref:uncharacterized protein LOC119678375 isoform X2 n=1 Tax=Teleopsis dalmanni TaxID=139649 RepID=UPI0018CD5B11|nr:uncharacterized protein LOC119678375 isoform X2 [Teleopsis dalmanni]